MNDPKPMPFADFSKLKPDFILRYKSLLKDDYDLFVKFSFSYLRKSIRVNTIKASVGDVVDSLSKRWNLTPIPWCKEGFWIDFKGDDIQKERFDIGNLPEHPSGLFYVQESASMIPPVALDPKPGELVLDMCASPGSKTSQMAALMNNEGLLIANDIQGSRLKPLAVNMQRVGAHNVVITKMHGANFKRKNILFDKILVDAPCSGTGTIRKSMKVLSMWSTGLVKRLFSEQKKLIAAAFEILKPGGEMVYSTCTQEPLENEGVVSWLLSEYPNAKVVPFKLDIKRSSPVLEWEDMVFHPSLKDSLRIYPFDNDTEGFFVCKIKKLV